MNRPQLRPTALRRFRQCEHGGAAVEFALAIPAFILLTFGAIGLSLMMYVNSAVHFATEDAARYASVHQLSGSTAVNTYALSKYKGPTIAGLQFNLNATAACGYQVTVPNSSVYTLRTGLRNISVPITATACYPAR